MTTKKGDFTALKKVNISCLLKSAEVGLSIINFPEHPMGTWKVDKISEE
jgi:hypothetical protein